VKNLDTGRVEITSQNHGFAVEQKGLEKAGGIVTHINLHDNTVEGFRYGKLPVFSVQYHREASPRPARCFVSVRCVHRNDEDEESADRKAIGGVAGAARVKSLSGLPLQSQRRPREFNRRWGRRTTGAALLGQNCHFLLEINRSAG
jgi:hypothetical protein